MPDKDLVPLNGRHLPHGYSDDVVQRALELMLEAGSIHLAQMQLEREMVEGDKDAIVPAWSTMCEWARADEDVISQIHRDRKRDMVALGFDAAMVSGQRMLGVIPNLPDSQVAVPHGIIWQRQTDLLRDQAGPTAAVQVNITSGGKKLED